MSSIYIEARLTGLPEAVDRDREAVNGDEAVSKNVFPGCARKMLAKLLASRVLWRWRTDLDSPRWPSLTYLWLSQYH